ncbi:hypothetical protein EW145_g5579 [Phellinidium pouzarii]|uniref:Uncharacterized protein n=1 Tax=Phellinidium pouzarii TaxID=167371 RepID=A0A4S4KZF5_9AGAM|nr:hypothetical protein EW145_g5579 [Phellinidium pouzarii]
MTGERDELITNPEGVPTFYQDRVVDKDPYAEPTTASDTLTGATSADVHDGYGHPGQGQTSAELHHDGQKGRKKQEVGVDQWGTQRPENMKAHVDERKRHFQS